MNKMRWSFHEVFVAPRLFHEKRHRYLQTADKALGLEEAIITRDVGKGQSQAFVSTAPKPAPSSKGVKVFGSAQAKGPGPGAPDGGVPGTSSAAKVIGTEAQWFRRMSRQATITTGAPGTRAR